MRIILNNLLIMTMEELCTASRYGLTSEETFMTVTNNLVGFHGMRMPAALSSHFYVIREREIPRNISTLEQCHV